eukprot:m.11911 g.11911  ORF g.11911 m.11911 type:complete len:511 (-) comp3920_c0_seq1:217-1749(-)
MLLLEVGAWNEGVLWSLLMTTIVLVIVWLGKKLIQRINVIRVIESLPGPKFKFPTGTFYIFPKETNIIDVKAKIAEDNKDKGVFRFWFGVFFAIVFVYTPEDIKTIINARCPKSKTLYRYVEFLTGKTSLLTTNGDQWHQMRLLLNPAFHRQLLISYSKVMLEGAKVFADKLEKTQGEETDIQYDLALLTLDIIGRCAMGYESNCQISQKDKYAASIPKITHSIIERFRKPLKALDWFYLNTAEGIKQAEMIKMAKTHVLNIVKKRREEVKSRKIEDISRSKRSTGKALLDLLDVLLLARDENGKGLTNTEIVDQCNTIMFAGHDTTSTCLSYLFYLFSTHQDVQQKCRDELFEAFGDDDPDFESLSELTYTTMCIKEALRMYPPVLDVLRRLEEPLKLKCGVTLPAGVDVSIFVRGVHYNSDVWENPEKFDPERFSNRKEVSQFQFMPFSVGERNCIGKNFAMNELRITVATVLRKFKILPAPDKKPIPVPRLVLTSQNGVNVKFQPLG